MFEAAIKQAKQKTEKAKAKSNAAAFPGSIISAVVEDLRERGKKASKGKNGDPDARIDIYSLTELVEEERISSKPPSRRIPTGVPAIDMALGGGVPDGRYMEVFGPEASGKSAFADVCAEGYQAAGGEVFYLEYEQTREVLRLYRQGILMAEKTVFSKPLHAEHGWAIVWGIIRQARDRARALRKKDKKAFPPPILIIWDSIGMTFTRKQLEYSENGKADMSDPEQPAEVARIMSPNIVRALKRMDEFCVSVIFVNHERAKFGNGVRPGTTTTPGGTQVKYSASIRIRTGSGKTSDDRGKKVFCRVVKNKLSPPYASFQFVIDYKKGPSRGVIAFYQGRDVGIIKPVPKQAGVFKVLKRTMKRVKFIKAMKEDPAFAADVWKAIGERTKVFDKADVDE